MDPFTTQSQPESSPWGLPPAPDGMEWVWVGETPPTPAPEGMEWVRIDDPAQSFVSPADRPTLGGERTPVAAEYLGGLSQAQAPMAQVPGVAEFPEGLLPVSAPVAQVPLASAQAVGADPAPRPRRPAWMANLITVGIATMALLAMLGLASLL